MKFKVLKQNRFAEGPNVGDIVDFDYAAARVPLMEGSLIPYNDQEHERKEYNDALQRVVEIQETNQGMNKLYNCKSCGERHKRTKIEKCDKKTSQ